LRASGKRAVPTPTIKPDTEIVGCSAAQNQAQSGRQATKLSCQDLYNWALYLVQNQSACSLGMISTSYKGTCDSGTLRVNSLYIQFEYSSWRVVAANGIPYHTYQFGAQRANPNYACEYYTVMLLPKTATTASAMSNTTMGPIGTANTGAYIYNHKSAESSCNAAGITEAPTFDSCNGHADPTCMYHYHKLPATSCAYSTNCSLVGYLYDGLPIYSYCNGYTSCYQLINSSSSGCDTSDYTYNAAASCQLDQANGRVYNGQYSYFITPNYPFVMPMMSGTRQRVCNINPN